MSTNDEPVVVWDLGNVLIPWDRHGALLAAVADDAEARRLAEEVFTLDVNVHLDRGDPLEEVRSVVERNHPELGWVVDAYLEHFEHSLGPQIDGSAEVLAELTDRGGRCVGLSNWSVVTFEGVPEAYPALSMLEGIVISGDVGAVKPDPAIYVHCEERFGFAPDQATFIDDTGRNVEAARRHGWDGIRFREPTRLREALVARGLL